MPKLPTWELETVKVACLATTVSNQCSSLVQTCLEAADPDVKGASVDDAG